MIVEKNKIVSILYNATDETGAVVDSNAELEPLAYLHGHGNILQRLEEALDGLQIAEEKKVTLTPGEAYGDFKPELVFEVSREQFPEGADSVQPGTMVQSSDGQELLVTDIDGDKIILDGNHPLAGRTLHFSVTIKNIRQPTAEELAHGHVHHAHAHDNSCGDGCGCH
ncbi:MAG TPA: peptidylprolyl isomerase [Agriterribacter sp.]|nr:peptidylprolyl isomerase [Agriterribacter sp.]HRQ49241.1 peptidylprolyl isomerase [Agriterribacter sp.]